MKHFIIAAFVTVFMSPILWVADWWCFGDHLKVDQPIFIGTLFLVFILAFCSSYAKDNKIV